MQIHQISECPELGNIINATRQASRRLYRTRLKEITPPAVATFVDRAYLPTSLDGETSKGEAILVKLPDDWEPHVGGLALARPELRVHSDIGLGAQAAYLSFSVEATNSELPLTAWLEASKVLEVHLRSEDDGADGSVPIAFVAGEKVAVATVRLDQATLDRFSAAARQAEKQPWVRDAEHAAKAKDVAKRYGERPWLFMRYELRTAGTRRLAVNWAAFPDDLPACVL